MDTLSQQIGENVRERVAALNLNFDEERIRTYVLQRFAMNTGQPTFKEIEEELGLPANDVVIPTISKLEAADVLSSNGERILTSYPFSGSETAHRVAFEDGRIVFALCTTDAVGVHFLLQEDITVFSSCPECNGPLSIAMKNGQLDGYQPRSLIEWVSSSNECGCNAESLCPFINFFCTKSHLNKWLERNEGRAGVVYSVQKVVEHSKAIYSDFLGTT